MEITTYQSLGSLIMNMWTTTNIPAILDKADEWREREKQLNMVGSYML